ncbi:MAG: DUF2092 domain-containing protein [Acetobacteraceae bacterium]|jgi:hypothetical protein
MSPWGFTKTALILVGLCGAGMIGVIPLTDSAVLAAGPAKPTISEEAQAAVAQMGKTLRADQFSFQVHTLRTYVEPSGQPLHIAHTINVVVRRPDRLTISVTGDDGSTKLFYDGKTVSLLGVESKKYSTIPVPPTIQGMLETVMGKLGVDFPLADFLTDAPDKSFLSGVTSGRVVNTVTIDGVPCRHLLFKQPPGLDLELWLEKTDQSLPRRLIVTYRSEPDEPSFIAEFSDWNFSAHPSDADFTFQPPEGSVQVALKPASKAAPPAQSKGAKP